ncbi:MAG: class I SAM-dependent methyltransferase [Chitinophagaceae bacterium]|nr:class I SAM-dependent methyltransferase [Chitinophagaceae bacterium]
MTTNIFITKWFHVFTHPFFLIRHEINNKIEVLAETISGKVLDFGCGAKPYAKYFIHAKEYIGLDIEKSGHSHEDEKIDVFYDGKKIPFDNDHFDAVFSSEVFEHIFNLEEILPEINRVLKPGGKLLFTCPFAWPEHEIPYDFARYSSFGIKAVVERQGFTVIEQYKTGHFFEVIMQYLIFIFLLFTQKTVLALLYPSPGFYFAFYIAYHLHFFFTAKKNEAERPLF